MYALAGGHELDATRKFRDRMYSRFNYLPPRIRATSTEHRSASAKLRGIVVHNKRFSHADKALFQDLVSGADRSDLNLSLAYVDFGEFSDPGAAWIDQARVPFAAHLGILARTDIYISGPGTAMLYAPFLPDGSVIVALPGAATNRANGAGGFMEQYLAAGCPYLRAIYYPYDKVALGLGLEAAAVHLLVARAASLIRGGFRMPADQAGNLAPDGRLFRDMCARDPAFCGAVTDRAGGLTDCNSQSFWAEDLARGMGHWAPGGPCAGAYNASLLEELREKHGIRVGPQPVSLGPLR